MKKRILTYLNQIDGLLANPPEAVDWEDEIAKHLVQIGFFQHERFIHLIVTVSFALITISAFLGLLGTENIALVPLIILLLILLVPYVFHYFLLENGVQKMYQQYDKMMEYRQTGKLPAISRTVEKL